MGGGAQSSSASGFQGFWGASFHCGATILRKNKNFAFTLAEVLITLGIIGVVAAMTLPTLVQKYQEKVTVTKLKKMYSILTQAYTMYKIDNPMIEPIDLSPEGAIQAFEIFKKQLKISKICGTDAKGCIGENYSKQNGTSWLNYSNNNHYYKIVLADGSALVFRGGSDEKYVCEIFYDINGKLPPNQWGTDLFEFDATMDGKIIPCGNTKKDIIKNCKNGDGWACTAWVIYNENMDYLHCDDLSWDGKTKCK